ncbi:hypothetical protein [Serratia sp. M24T3]|uniref:hypothetical protein n=1 Tax=Serratia sp. M24T3 TaxID=932213 RepID=UPI00025B8F32|nr:hypothetical protein [Serratia sp. M24T3]EIC83976.1 hypothetical protein SPM24T3_13705 [Serratia sp. M24T3]
MEKFDRALQLEILKILYDTTPTPLDDEQEKSLISKFSDENQFIANLLYLEQHGLIFSGVLKTAQMIGASFNFFANECSITSKGIDFLLDDGGLGAILNVQTIRLHNETIIALEDIISISNLPPEEQKGLISKLRDLPADAIKYLTSQLLVKGVLNLPAAIPIIEKFLHHG